MNCYDFDKTIFRTDSSVDFYCYCLIRHPKMLRRLPRQLAAFVRHYVKKAISKTQMKEIFYEYFQDIPDMDKTLSDFWDKNLRKVKSFYRGKQKDDDVIISASPEFFLKPAAERLGILHLLGSPVDPKTGKYLGENCHGEEKVRRFYEVFPHGEIEEFYSDSLSDSPLAEISQRAFLVKGDFMMPWDME